MSYQPISNIYSGEGRPAHYTVPEHVTVKERVETRSVYYEWYAAGGAGKPDYSITKEIRDNHWTRRGEDTFFVLYEATGQTAITDEYVNPFGKELHASETFEGALNYFINNVLNRKLEKLQKMLAKYQVATGDFIADIESIGD